jgi:hypothetical protein
MPCTKLALAEQSLIWVNQATIVRAFADDAPRSYVALPDVYKVIAENDKTKVILATSKPGQRDNWHSHPASGVYFLTDCEARLYTPDGKFTDGSPKAGCKLQSRSIRLKCGNAECRIIIVEQER